MYPGGRCIPPGCSRGPPWLAGGPRPRASRSRAAQLAGGGKNGRQPAAAHSLAGERALGGGGLRDGCAAALDKIPGRGAPPTRAPPARGGWSLNAGPAARSPAPPTASRRAPSAGAASCWGRSRRPRTSTMRALVLGEAPPLAGHKLPATPDCPTTSARRRSGCRRGRGRRRAGRGNLFAWGLE